MSPEKMKTFIKLGLAILVGVLLWGCFTLIKSAVFPKPLDEGGKSFRNALGFKEEVVGNDVKPYSVSAKTDMENDLDDIKEPQEIYEDKKKEEPEEAAVKMPKEESDIDDGNEINKKENIKENSKEKDLLNNAESRLRHFVNKAMIKEQQLANLNNVKAKTLTKSKDSFKKLNDDDQDYQGDEKNPIKAKKDDTKIEDIVDTKKMEIEVDENKGNDKEKMKGKEKEKEKKIEKEKEKNEEKDQEKPEGKDKNEIEEDEEVEEEDDEVKGEGKEKETKKEVEKKEIKIGGDKIEEIEKLILKQNNKEKLLLDKDKVIDIKESKNSKENIKDTKNLVLAENEMKIPEAVKDDKKTPKLTPDWASSDARPLPKWFDQAKIGIFIHWGVYSVPAFGDSAEWFWKKWKSGRSEDIEIFVNETQKPGFTYQDYASQFTGDLFDPEEWADVFEASGAKYVVLTSKHHDGFTLWPSKYSFSWNSVDLGPHRDIVGELAAAINSRKSLKFGLYYSLYEWFNRLYLSDKGSNFQNKDFVSHKMIPELKELITKYKPKTLWLDGDWDATSTYWEATNFLQWLYNESPIKESVVTNDRWGSDSRGVHGDYLTFLQDTDQLPLKKYEYALSIDKHSWGFSDDSDLENYISSNNLVKSIVKTVAKGGNILINIGPNRRGVISPIMRERLRDMGNWLQVNGEAIYGTQKRQISNENNDIWYTVKNVGDAEYLYAILLSYPESKEIVLSSVKKVLNGKKLKEISILGYDGKIEFKEVTSSLTVTLPEKNSLERTGLSIAWTLRLKYVTSN